MNYKILVSGAAVISAALLFSCGGKPLFTEMATNRLRVKIIGTYESGGVIRAPFLPHSVTEINDDSVSSCEPGTDAYIDNSPPAKLMLDIAEIRLGSYSNAWAKFANYRQTYSITISDTDPFFSGEGIELINDDPGNDNFTYVWLYVRKMIFDGAKRYDSSCTELPDQAPETYFNEKKVKGLDWNQFQVRTHWDSLRKEGSGKNRAFPVKIPIAGGMKYNSEDGETVLEIRMVVKNFLKRYEYSTISSSGNTIDRIRFFGLSDWLRDVQTGDSDMGGNLQTVARSYVPSRAGTITGTNSGATGYIIAVRDNPVVIADYTGPASNPRNHDCNFPVMPSFLSSTPEGFFDYYRRYEVYKNKWNDVHFSCSTIAKYEEEWEAYRDAVAGFRVPELAVYSAGSGAEFTITNVPAGTYRLYRAAAPAYAELFVENDFTDAPDVCVVAEGAVATGCDLL